MRLVRLVVKCVWLACHPTAQVGSHCQKLRLGQDCTGPTIMNTAQVITVIPILDDDLLSSQHTRPKHTTLMERPPIGGHNKVNPLASNRMPRLSSAANPLRTWLHPGLRSWLHPSLKAMVHFTRLAKLFRCDPPCLIMSNVARASLLWLCNKSAYCLALVTMVRTKYYYYYYYLADSIASLHHTWPNTDIITCMLTYGWSLT